jgi:hypothetical protein
MSTAAFAAAELGMALSIAAASSIGLGLAERGHKMVTGAEQQRRETG